jgi:hypothetical protein
MTKLAQVSEEQLSDEEDYYTVEKILQKSKKGKKTLYLVKWDGWPES